MTHHWLHSAIEHVLDRRSPNGAPGFTLEDLLDEDNFLGEARAQNRRLLDFLVQPEQLERLANLLTHSPLPSVPESPLASALPSLLTDAVTRSYRHAAIVADLLSDVPEVRDAVLQRSEVAGTLFALLTKPPPLDVQLLTLVCAVLSAWLDQVCSSTVEVWLSCEPDAKAVVKAWIGNIHHPSLTKLLSKLATLAASAKDSKESDSDNSDDPEVVVKAPPSALLRRIRSWLRRGRLLSALLEHLSIDNAYGMREGCEQLLLDLLDTVPHTHLNQAENGKLNGSFGADLLTEATAITLMSTVLVDGTGANIVVRALLLYSPADNEDYPNAGNVLPPFLTAVCTTLPSIGSLLISAATSSRRVGLRTLRLLEVVQALACVASVSPWRRAIVDALLNSAEQPDFRAGVLGACCVLFFARPWHNVLHAAILDLYAVLVRALTASPKLMVRVVLETEIVQQLAEAVDGNAIIEQASYRLRQGHMGHIVSLARIIRQTSQSMEELTEALNDRPEWAAVGKITSPRTAASTRTPDSELLSLARSLPPEEQVSPSLSPDFTFPTLPEAHRLPPPAPSPPDSDPSLRLTAPTTRMREQMQNLHLLRTKLDIHPSDKLF